MKLPNWIKRVFYPLPKLKENEYFDLKDMITPEQKADFIKGFMAVTGKESMKVYYMTGLNWGFEQHMVNDSNGDEFILSFKKVKSWHNQESKPST